jgi:hypothetical protein
MIFSSSPLFNSLKVYIIIIILLVFLKPNFIYDKTIQKFRQFGTNKGNTIFSLPVLSIFLAVILYIIFLWIDKLKNFNNLNNLNKPNNNFSMQQPMQQIHTIPQYIQPIPQFQYYPQYYPQIQHIQQIPLQINQ